MIPRVCAIIAIYACAAPALADVGPKTAETTDQLIAILTRFDETEHARAVVSLGKIGKPAVPPLEKLLTHEDEMTRHLAAWALGLVGEPAKSAVPALMKILAVDPDDAVRGKAVFALARILPRDADTLKILVKALPHHGDPFSSVRIAVCEELPHWGEQAIPVLAKASARNYMHLGTQPTLHELLNKHQTRTAAESMRPYVIDHFANDMASLSWGGGLTRYFSREEALSDTKGLCQVLVTLGDDVVKPLDAPLRGKDAKERDRAILTLSRMAETLVLHGRAPELADRIIKRLVPFCGHEDPQVRLLAISNIPYTKATDAILRNALMGDDADLRHAALTTTRRYDVDLMQSLYDRLPMATGMERLRIATARATMYREQETQKIVRSYLTDKDAALRHHAAYIIASYQPMRAIAEEDIGNLAVPILLESQKSADPVKRRQAIEGLVASAKFLGAERAPFLLKVLKETNDPILRQRVLFGLSLLASEERPDVVAAVRPLLADPDPRMRYAAVTYFIRSPKSGLPELVKIFPDRRDWSVHEKVFRFLEQQLDDPRAEEAILQLAADKNGWMAMFALLRHDAKKHYPRMLAIWRKQDAILDKTVAILPKTPTTCDETVLALTARFKRSDLTLQRRVAYCVPKVIHYVEADPTPWFVPLDKSVNETLAQLRPKLDDKNADVRRDVVLLLWQLQTMQQSVYHVFQRKPPREVAIPKEIEATNRRIRAMLILACSDRELTIRRLARKAVQGFSGPELTP